MLACAAGVAFRLWLGFGPLASYDSDESIVGLMAMHLLHHGKLSVFYWGQPYGGSLDAVLAAPFVALFGTNIVGLRAANFLVGLAAPILSWRIAKHFFDAKVAWAVGLLALVYPAAAVWFGTSERGFYPLTAALGLAAVLLAVNIDEQPTRARWWVGFGLVVGVGWWTSPNIGYYAVPLAVWLVLRGHWRRGRNISLGVVAALLGSAPWLWVNLHSGFASAQPPDWAGNSTYGSRLQFFFTHALPYAFATRLPWGSAWVFSPRLGEALFVFACVIAVAGIFMTVRAAAKPVGLLQSPDLLLLAVSPFLFALSPPNWRLVEGRYVYFVASLIPLVLARVMTRRVGVAAVCALVAFTSIAFLQQRARLQEIARPSTVAIARALQANGYHTAIADYWTAYQLTFTAGEKVIATPTYHPRYKPYLAEVNASAPAYVFRVSKSPTDGWLIDELNAAGIGYRTITGGQYFAILPSQRFVTQRAIP